MKKILLALGLLIVSQLTMSQTTIVNGLQVNSAKGTPPNQVLPVNAGMAYIDVNGIVKKSTIQSLLGKKVDSAQRLNDSTVRFTTINGTYDVTLRGLYDVISKGFVDSLRTGKIKDTTVVVNQGTGLTKLAYTGNLSDSLYISTLKDSADIKFKQNPDHTVAAYLVHTAVNPGTYGDATHAVRATVDSNGRITGIVVVSITGGASGALTKKTLNSQGGTSYTLVSADSNVYITANNGSTVTISVPDDATAAMTSPITIDVYQLGAGRINFQPLNNSVFLNARGGKLRSAGQYSRIILNKISPNNWILSGDLDTTTVSFLSTSVGSLSGFTTSVGTPSTSQSFTISGFNLTAGATVTAPTNYEVSLDNTTFANTQSISLSGTSLSGQPVLVYVRITSGAATGTVSGNVAISSTGASTVNVSVTGVNNSTSPTITTTGTPSPFTNLAGTASSSQTITASGTNLTADVLVTAPSGFEISLDNSSYATTKTLVHSGTTLVGQPVTVYIRVAAATLAGSYSGNVALTSTGATTKNIAVSATVSSGSVNMAKWNFSLTALSVSGWNNMFGNPNNGLSSTDATTGWQLQTNAGEWYNLGGFYWASNTDGGSSTGGSYGTDFPSTVVAGLFYTGGSEFAAYYSSSDVTYPFVLNNLAAGNYTIKIIPSYQTGVRSGPDNGNVEYHASFGGGADQMVNNVSERDNTQNQVTFTGTITSGQVIRFGPYRNGATGGFSACNAIIIIKNF